MTQPPPWSGTNPPPTAPVSAVERFRYAYQDRGRTDYVFTNIGVTILLIFVTCGVFAYYIFYQLVRRMRDHNQRRLALLEAANEIAWERALQQGLAEELRPNFERIGTHLAVLRGMTSDFRDPAIWLLLQIVTGVAGIIMFVFLDQDLIKHDRNEGAVESELTEIFGRLGNPISPPNPARVKAPHNYAGRIAATIASCGIYSYWWYYDLMIDGNNHFAQNWPWEDGVAGAVHNLTQAS